MERRLGSGYPVGRCASNKPAQFVGDLFSRTRGIDDFPVVLSGQRQIGQAQAAKVLEGLVVFSAPADPLVGGCCVDIEHHHVRLTGGEAGQ